MDVTYIDVELICEIEAVLGYLWADEQKDFCSCKHPKEGHIFLSLLRLNDGLKLGFTAENCGDEGCPFSVRSRR